jgi:tRNA-specific 2-thiouridylase
MLDGERVAVEFLEAPYAITPGQAAVFYQGERVLGGGWISESCG